MLRVLTGNFKPGRGIEFINWFRKEENIAKLKDAFPGYVNSYIVERGNVDYEFVIVGEIENYAVLDDWNSSEKVKQFMREFNLELGFYGTDFKESFLKSVDEVNVMDLDLFKQIMAKEKARSS